MSAPAAAPQPGTVPAAGRGRDVFLDERWVWALVAGLLVARVLVAAHRIGEPGLHYDEVLFVNAADERIPGTFIHRTVLGVPVMVFPYIGAVKSAFYAPLFAVVDPSALTIRLPGILVTSAAIAVVFVAVRRLLGTPVAVVASVALSLDQSLFWLTREDPGPIVPEFACKALMLLLAARYARRGDTGSLAGLLVVMAIGVYAKLNFIWFVNAVAVVSLVLLLTHRELLRQRRFQALVWAIGLAAIYAGFAWLFVAHDVGVGRAQDLAAVLGHTWEKFSGPSGMEAVLSGEWFYAYALGDREPSRPAAWSVIALFVTGVVMAARGHLHATAVLALAGSVVLVVAQILLLREATAGWHYAAVLPAVTIVAAFGLVEGTLALLGSRRAAGVVVAAILALAGVHALGVLRASFGAAGEPKASVWTPAIDELQRTLEREPGHVLVGDWGIQAQLVALDPSTRYEEISFALAEPVDSGALATIRQRAVNAAPGTLFVTHAPGAEAFPGARAALLSIISDLTVQEQTIRSRGGRPMFEVYRRTATSP